MDASHTFAFGNGTTVHTNSATGIQVAGAGALPPVENLRPPDGTCELPFASEVLAGRLSNGLTWHVARGSTQGFRGLRAGPAGGGGVIPCHASAVGVFTRNRAGRAAAAEWHACHRYVRKNKEPQHRIELRLAVRVGSLSEEEEERGIAHIVEHLAFRATRDYGKFEIINFLESIGAPFGPCQVSSAPPARGAVVAPNSRTP
jgi:hypothetical protein